MGPRLANALAAQLFGIISLLDARDHVYYILHLSLAYLLLFHGILYHENWKLTQPYQMVCSRQNGCRGIDHFFRLGCGQWTFQDPSYSISGNNANVGRQ